MANVKFKRKKFSVVGFARKYNLGLPVAGNFFISRSEKEVITTKRSWCRKKKTRRNRRDKKY